MASDISSALRAQVAQRANHCCEYCLIHEDDAAFSHQVDHVVSRKHGGASSIENLAYACVLCNRYKGSDVASIDELTGEAIRLYDPRHSPWTKHFRLNSAIMEPLTPQGKATIQILRLNSAERVAERALLGLVNA